MSFFRNIIVLAVLIGIVYFVLINQSFVENKIFPLLHIPTQQVKGSNIENGSQISQQMKTDFASTLSTIEKQAGNIKLSQVLSILTNVQKIPKEIQSVQKFFSGVMITPTTKK